MINLHCGAIRLEHFGLDDPLHKTPKFEQTLHSANSRWALALQGPHISCPGFQPGEEEHRCISAPHKNVKMINLDCGAQSGLEHFGLDDALDKTTRIRTDTPRNKLQMGGEEKK